MRTFTFLRYGAYPDAPVSSAELARWSAATGHALPQRYVDFIVRHNGGSIWPCVFDHQHPALAPVAALSELFDWPTVVQVSRLDKPADERIVAPDHLIIGRTSTDDDVVLRLLHATPGPVWLRGHNTTPNWSNDREDQFGFIAESFDAFIDQLREPEPGESVYLDVWEPTSGTGTQPEGAAARTTIEI